MTATKPVDVSCPRCGNAWPANCDQATAIELYQQCIPCKFGPRGDGTLQEWEALACACARRKQHTDNCGTPLPAREG